MAVATKNHKENAVFNRLINELEAIKLQLRKLILLIPEESLREYSNGERIKASFRKAVKRFPPAK